jgi:hypothetical protein
MLKVDTRRYRVQETGVGMNRFFSPVNLDRYRRLASGTIGDAEQYQLLEDLAAEMNAFRREARMAAVGRRPACMESADSLAAGQYEHTTRICSR